MQIYRYFLNKTNLGDIYYKNNELNTYYNMNKKLIRLTESDLHRIVKESVNKVLRETIRQRNYYVKEVECYTEGGEDIVYVAALSENGVDGIAKRRVREKYPNLEIIQVYDVPGAIDVDDMTNAQYHFCQQGAIMLPNDWDGMTDVRDLEWIPELI